MRANTLIAPVLETDALDVGGSTITDINSNRGKNLLINGNFDIWQRQTTFSATGYFADRWKSYNLSGATYTFTRQLETAAFKQSYFGRLDITAGSSASRGIEQRIEEVVTAGGDTVTLSFYAKTDVARTLELQISQYFGSGGSVTVSTPIQEVTTTTAWAKYTATFDIASTSGKTIGAGNYLSLTIRMKNITTGTLDIGQVQLEVGEDATDFDYKPLAEIDALCKRYYEKSYPFNAFPGAVSASGMAWVYTVLTTSIVNNAGGSEKFKVEKRTTPTMSAYSTSGGSAGYARDWSASQDVVCNIAGQGSSGFYWYCSLYATTTSISLGMQWVADAEL